MQLKADIWEEHFTNLPFYSLKMHLFTLSSQHTLDGVTRDRIEEEKQEDGQEENDDHFDDRPFVVVPDNVAN